MKLYAVVANCMLIGIFDSPGEAAEHAEWVTKHTDYSTSLAEYTLNKPVELRKRYGPRTKRKTTE